MTLFSICSREITASSGGLDPEFSLGQMRWRQYTSSIAYWYATRSANVSVLGALSGAWVSDNAWFVGAPKAAEMGSAEAAMVSRIAFFVNFRAICEANFFFVVWFMELVGFCSLRSYGVEIIRGHANTRAARKSVQIFIRRKILVAIRRQ